jgi:YggT family protein
LPVGPSLVYQQPRASRVKGCPLLFYTLFEIVGYLISIIVMLVIVQFVLSLLIAFNVVNMHNQFVEAIWRAVNALLDPLLSPIRRIMPHTGAIDFSPLVLIILLQILSIILRNLAVATM